MISGKAQIITWIILMRWPWNVQAIRRAGRRLWILLILRLAVLTVSGIETQAMDTAAGCLMVEESGGLVSDLFGKKWNIYSPHVLASNGSIHKK